MQSSYQSVPLTIKARQSRFLVSPASTKNLTASKLIIARFRSATPSYLHVILKCFIPLVRKICMNSSRLDHFSIIVDWKIWKVADEKQGIYFAYQTVRQRSRTLSLAVLEEEMSGKLEGKLNVLRYATLIRQNHTAVGTLWFMYYVFPAQISL